MIRRHLLALAVLLLPRPVHSQEDTLTLGGRRVVAWRPSGPGMHPVVIFSHGLGGCPTQSRFLTEGLAAHGYLVVAPFHRDAGCDRRRAAPRPAFPFDAPARWNDLTYADRIADIRAIVAALPSSPIGGSADLSRLAVAGHSLGGYTALSLGGAWTLTRMPEVRAVLAMAPYAAPFLAHGTMSEVAVPVMFQGGSLDGGITAALDRPGGAFDSVREPKYLVEFVGARHSSWGNRPNASHEAMLAYAAAFLDRYVRDARDASDESADAVLGNRLAGVAALRVSRSAER